jgi:DNA-binding MarR family transcriptional regulator
VVAADHGDHQLSATERSVASRLEGLEIDITSMAVVQNLYRSANAVRHHLERVVLTSHGLSWSGWVVLWVVWIWEEIEPRQLAGEAGIAKGTVTGLVKTLEERGLLIRDTHPEDARRILLRLTPSGGRLMRRVLPELNREETVIVDRLGADGGVMIAQHLRALAMALEE